jgi:hypothetical protein
MPTSPLSEKAGVISSLKRLIRDKMFTPVTDEQRFDDTTWRMQRYMCPDTDEVLQTYYDLLQEIYEKYTGKQNRSWEKDKFMSKDEFTELVHTYGISSDSRYIERSFHMSLMTWIDELYSTRYM